MPIELFWTTRQMTKLRSMFNSNMVANIKFSKAQLSKSTPSAWFLGAFLSKIASPLIKVAVLLAKNIFASLRATAATAIDAGL